MPNREKADEYLKSANLFRKIGEYQKAIDLYGEAIKEDPTYVEAHRLKAMLHAHQHNDAGVVNTLKEALKLTNIISNYKAEFLTNIGVAQLNLGNYKDAIDAFHKSLDINVNSNHAKIYLSLACMKNNQSTDARLMFSSINKENLQKELVNIYENVEKQLAENTIIIKLEEPDHGNIVFIDEIDFLQGCKPLGETGFGNFSLPNAIEC